MSETDVVAKGLSPGLGGWRRRRTRREEGWVFGWRERRRLEDEDGGRQRGGEGGNAGRGGGGDRFGTRVRRGRTGDWNKQKGMKQNKSRTKQRELTGRWGSICT